MSLNKCTYHSRWLSPFHDLSTLLKTRECRTDIYIGRFSEWPVKQDVSGCAGTWGHSGDKVAYLVGILGIDIIFNSNYTVFWKVLGCNLHQIGDFGLFAKWWVSVQWRIAGHLLTRMNILNATSGVDGRLWAWKEIQPRYFAKSDTSIQ